MSRTLSLVDSLLVSARTHQQLGREHDALRLFKKLAALGELPAEVAEEAQANLAEIQIHRGRFAKARRHLSAALAYQPDSADYHALMAGALAADDRKGDRERAIDHYRQALRLDPDQPRWLSEFGQLAVRMGQVEEGIDALRRAVELAPEDPQLVKRLVQTLGEEGREQEAHQALRTALFRNSRDSRFHRLYHQWRFQQVRQAQMRARTLDPQKAEPGRPVILQFIHPVRDDRDPPDGNQRGQIIRRDQASRPYKPRHGRLGQRRAAT